MTSIDYSALAAESYAPGDERAARRVAVDVAKLGRVALEAAPFIGGVVGYMAWTAHPVLGALNGAAAAQNAVGLLKGVSDAKRVARRTGAQLTATLGALSGVTSAPVGYVVGGIVGSRVMKKLLPMPEIAPYEALAKTGRRTILGFSWSDLDKANPLDWGDVANAGRVVAPAAGAVVDAYIPGAGTAGANLAEQGIDAAQGRKGPTVRLSPDGKSGPVGKGAGAGGPSQADIQASLDRAKAEAAASQRQMEESASGDRWKMLGWGAVGIGALATVGLIVHKVVTR